MYSNAIISNLPTIMFTVSNSFGSESIFTDVIPAVKPVVDTADTDSNKLLQILTLSRKILRPLLTER